MDTLLWDDVSWVNLLYVNLQWDNLWGKTLGCHVGMAHGKLPFDRTFQCIVSCRAISSPYGYHPPNTIS